MDLTLWDFVNQRQEALQSKSNQPSKENTMSISIDRLVESIRYDVDYHCIETRNTAPLQGSINRELYTRLKRAEKKDNPVYPPGMRLRVLNSLGMKATHENHELFDKAVEIFKERLSMFDEDANEDYSGTDVVIEG